MKEMKRRQKEGIKLNYLAEREKEFIAAAENRHLFCLNQ